jgi:hypothetical protein
MKGLEGLLVGNNLVIVAHPVNMEHPASVSDLCETASTRRQGWRHRRIASKRTFQTQKFLVRRRRSKEYRKFS